MEREIERTIREKIDVVEQKSVKWEMEGAWNKINTELRPKKKPPIFYYAAASFTLATAMVIYSVQFFKQKELDQKIESLELAIKSSYSKPKDDQFVLLPSCLEENPLRPDMVEIKPLVRKEKNIGKISPILNTLITSDHSKETQGPQTEMEVQVEEPKPVPKVTIAAKANRVEPIIGVIIPEKEPIMIAKEKKIKFRLFKSPEKDDDRKEEDTKILFARIN